MKGPSRIVRKMAVVGFLLVTMFVGALLAAPTPAHAQGGDCHIGNPQCTPSSVNGLIPIPDPSMVRISHGRGDGSVYYIGETIYIYLYHSTGGYVDIYDMYPYMEPYPRRLWHLWLPPGQTRVIRARMAPPTGEEWLTIHDPATGAYDRTNWYVRSYYQPPSPRPPWPWPYDADVEDAIDLAFDRE